MGIWTSERVQSHCSQFIWTHLVSKEISKLPILLGMDARVHAHVLPDAEVCTEPREGWRKKGALGGS